MVYNPIRGPLNIGTDNPGKPMYWGRKLLLASALSLAICATNDKPPAITYEPIQQMVPLYR